MPVCGAANSGVNSAMSCATSSSPVMKAASWRGRARSSVKRVLSTRQQEQGIGARGDEVVLAGQLRGLGAAGVDQHQLAAAGRERLDAFFHIRHGPDAAVGGDGVGPQHQEVVGAVDVRESGTGTCGRTATGRPGGGAAGPRWWRKSGCWCAGGGTGCPGGSSCRSCARWDCPGRCRWR